jgi:hypothetical protein
LCVFFKLNDNAYFYLKIIRREDFDCIHQKELKV